MMKNINPAPESADIWAELVTIVLPRVVVATPEVMKAQKQERIDAALKLAAAALRAAGEHTLAENLLD